MEKIDLNDLKDNTENKGESDFFKIPTGKTKMRVLTDFVKVETLWEGKYPNSKYLGFYEGEKVEEPKRIDRKGWCWAWVYDINGEKVEELKILKLSFDIIGKIANLKQNPDYSWEEMPMPFDVTLLNTGNGPQRYSIEPARSNTDITTEMKEALEEATPILEILEKIKAKRERGDEIENKQVDYPDEEINPEDIPF